MVDVSRILEIKKNGVDSATVEDIQLFYNIVVEYLNTEAQDAIKDLNIKISINIDGNKSSLIIKGAKAEFQSGDVGGADVILFSDVETMVGIAAGLLDAQKAFLSGDLEVEGEFDKMIVFIELLEGVYEKLGIASVDERDILIDVATMRKLYDIYEAGATDVDLGDIQVFLDIFCNFINLNEKARDILVDEKFRIQMIIKEAGCFLIYKNEEDGIVKWSEGKVDDVILEFEVSIKTAINVLLGGDAAAAYLSGEVEATGNIAQTLIFQELLESFLEILPFTS